MVYMYAFYDCRSFAVTFTCLMHKFSCLLNLNMYDIHLPNDVRCMETSQVTP